jgi:hypothetical protein
MRAMLALNSPATDIATTVSVENYRLFKTKGKPRATIMTVEHNRYVHQCVIPPLSLLLPFVRRVTIALNYKIVTNYHQHN